MLLVKFYAGLRDKLGVSQVVLPEAPSDIAAMIESLAARYGDQMRRTLLESGDLSPGVIVLLNGHNVRLGDGLAARLSAGDEVAIFPMISGG